MEIPAEVVDINGECKDAAPEAVQAAEFIVPSQGGAPARKVDLMNCASVNENDFCFTGSAGTDLCPETCGRCPPVDPVVSYSHASFLGPRGHFVFSFATLRRTFFR